MPKGKAPRRAPSTWSARRSRLSERSHKLPSRALDGAKRDGTSAEPSLEIVVRVANSLLEPGPLATDASRKRVELFHGVGNHVAPEHLATAPWLKLQAVDVDGHGFNAREICVKKATTTIARASANPTQPPPRGA
jgi:hypothetical protein